MDKRRKFLLDFYEFLGDNNHGMVYFKLVSGQECQGYISDIYDETFEYHDSGPWAREDPYFFNIADINAKSFAYWDEVKKQWLEYPTGKVLIPTPVSKRRSVWYYIAELDKYLVTRETRVKNWLWQTFRKLK
jgi:hypothetical protein